MVASSFGEFTITTKKCWSGYCIRPISIEFLTFTERRLHIRELYSRVENGWIKSYLQP